MIDNFKELGAKNLPSIFMHNWKHEKKDRKN